MARVYGTFSAPGTSSAWTGSGDFMVSLRMPGNAGSNVQLERSLDAGVTFYPVYDSVGNVVAFERSADIVGYSASADIQWRLRANAVNGAVTYELGA